MSSSRTFIAGNYVVYPSHGVGKITSITTKNVANLQLEFYDIFFEKEKMALSVPVNHAEKIGLRKLCSLKQTDEALNIIREKAQTSRGIMWSRRAQEYERKINSGNILSIAEVIRDLQRNVGNPDRSFSERVIYESAYNRFAKEVALVKKIDFDQFSNQLSKILKINEIVPQNDNLEDSEDDDFIDDDHDNNEPIAA